MDENMENNRLSIDDIEDHMPNMLSSWNKVIIIIITGRHSTATTQQNNWPTAHF